MKYLASLAGLLLAAQVTTAQNYPHYTMFMYNKLLYNPAYAGNKNMTSLNAGYRSQWTGIDGAPKTISVALDAPIGSYMKAFRPVALGLSISNESMGVSNNTNIMGYYAYRIPLKTSVLSFGIEGGVSVFSARFNDLTPSQGNDVKLTQNVNGAILPNCGAGVFWSSDKFYLGASVPNLLQNYYDKDSRGLTNTNAKQLRSYYMSGGYIIKLSEDLKLEPQLMARYAGNAAYQLPFNMDVNLSLIFLDRLMIGATYRTDNSIDGIINIQATKWINVGYAYGYSASKLNGYNNGTHEIVVGFDFIKDLNKYVNPRFIRPF